MNRPHHDQDLNRGLDLFNRAHFFDAHEVLEDVWRALPRASAAKKHLQGLVQLAVAFHHESRGNLRGARSVLDRALQNLDGAEESLPDLDLKSLHASLKPWREHLARTRPGRPSSSPQAHHLSDPELPKIVLRDRLR
jgi:predicted metal-dependent hydrolase